MVIIDTVGACFTMKCEDDNAEVTCVCNALRRIGEAIGALTAPVHHLWKNAANGLRGASAWVGNADVIETVLADIDPLTGKTSGRELVLTKSRDGEQGPLAPFTLEFITLGHNDDGEPYGSCCVAPQQPSESKFTVSAMGKGKRTILDAITEALDTCGKTIAPRTGMADVKAAMVSDIRNEFDRRYVVDERDPHKANEAKRRAFQRALDKLPPTHFGAGAHNGFDWIWRIEK